MAGAGALDPTDDAIEARLAAVPAERWERLWAAADAIAASDEEHAKWAGGEQVDAIAADGETRTAFQMHYVVTSDALNRFFGSLTGVTGVVPFDWPAWRGFDRYPGGRGLENAPVADAVRMVTTVVRADRFTEGAVASALADGTLMAVVDRLRAWHDAGTR